MRRTVAAVLSVIMLIALFNVAGCSKQASKKPLTTTPQNKVTKPGTTTTKKAQPVSPLGPSETRKLADKLTNLAVKVKGVRSATVVVQPSNNRAAVLVGLTLEPGVKGSETNKIKKQVRDKLKKADKRITRVLVTSDPNLVRRIEDIARGIIAGKPVQSFASEISELTRRIAPTMK